jgi:Alpha-L-rhamnosidase N-terminal domain./Bacterial alpha-L-rhamnosidase.
MKRIVIVISILATVVTAMAKPAVTPVCLNCNDMVEPLAVTNVNFGWKLASSVNGACQSAYELWVGTTPRCDGNTWKSGKVASEDQFSIKLPPEVELIEGKQYFWKVRLWDGDGMVSPWSEPASFTVSIDDSWTADWIESGDASDGPLPIFRKSFIVSRGKVKKAIVYLCGLGCSQLWLNGAPVDPSRILDPAQTDYEKRALYSAFDVTSRLSADGSNCIGVMLGDGWFSQDKVWGGGMTYGEPRFRCQMLIEYSNGKTETLGTDTSWKWTAGPLVKSNVYMGDEYDATREIDGWCMASFDDGSWKSAVKATGVIPAGMYAQEIPPMRAGEPMEAVRMWRSSKDGNVWIYDFGKNLTADVIFSAELPRGTMLRTRGAEFLSEDQELDFDSISPNLVGYQQDSYTFAGKGRETWMPVFTYHGMRYVELTVIGSEAEPSIDWIKIAPVHTDLKTIGSFECSDHQIDYLHEIAVNTFLNAFVGLPVDCNQREKCGWLGDVHAYDKAANMNFQMNNFWLKYLEDIKTSSDVSLSNTLHHKLYNSTFYFSDKPAGIPFMIAPGKRLCGVASPDWGTVVVQLPWHLYLYYGNRQILEDYYNMMSLWVHHISATTIDNIVYQGLGDWCPMYSDHVHNPTAIEFSSTAFHLLDLGIMTNVAEILGREDDAGWFQEHETAVRNAMKRKFFNPVKCSFGSETADAMALELNLFPEGLSEEGAKGIKWSADHSRQKFIDVGIFGFSRIGSQMARNGAPDEVYELFTKKGEDSFGIMVDSLRVTTLWESLPMSSKDYRAHHGSHCHPMQGGYDSWMYEDIAGIRPLVSSPGFKTVLFAPQHVRNLYWAKASVDTRYGVVSSSWSKEDGRLVWDISIPAGSRGLVDLPEYGDGLVTVNGAQLSFPRLVIDGVSGYSFPSGSYHIVVEAEAAHCAGSQ